MITDPIRIVIAYHSGYGHTAAQAQAVARGAAEASGTSVEPRPVDELTDELWAALDAADAIIFGAPTYMGGPSGVFKLFADASSKVWFRGGWWTPAATSRPARPRMARPAGPSASPTRANLAASWPCCASRAAGWPPRAATTGAGGGPAAGGTT